MQSKAKTVSEYLKSLPEDRRKEMKKIRKVIKDNLPAGFEEGMQYGMIGYYVPLKEYPETYNGEALGIIALASQKNYMSLYLMAVYGNTGIQDKFEQGFEDAGKKLNMGKSCVRFKTVDDLPLDVVVETIASVTPKQFIDLYEKARKKK